MSKKINVDSINVPLEVDAAAQTEQPVLVDKIQEVEPSIVKNNRLKNILFKNIFEKTEKLPKPVQEKEEKVKPEKPIKLKEKSIEDGKKQFFHRRRIIEWVIIFVVFFVPLISIAGAAFAEGVLYKDKIFYGVTVWGVDVRGKTPEEVQKIITDKFKNYKVTLSGPDQYYVATAGDLGLILDPKNAALDAYSIGKKGNLVDKYYTRVRLVLSKINWPKLQSIVGAKDFEIIPNYQVDEKMVDQFIEKISSNINIKPQDSQVTTEGGSLKLVPAVYGREISKEKLKKALLANVQTFDTNNILIETTEIKPNIIDKDAEQVRVQTENVISRPIILSYDGQTFQPDRATVASWISYTKAAGATNYTMIVDTSKMSNYFTFLGTKINIYQVPKKVRVENGVKETVTQDGKDGLLVDNTLLGKQISEQLPVKSEVKLSVPTYVDPFKTEYERVVVANWDKYIDVNLSTQTMQAYLKGGQLVGSWSITSGASGLGYYTPVGTSLIYGKIFVTSMPNPPSPYPLENIHYVSYFKEGGYAIHEAWWRSSFGGDPTWNGSHGCVNAPIEVAQFIYDWAPIGTPVTVHY